jgi:hypothetical protein
MVAIHLPLDSLSGRGLYGMKGKLPLIRKDEFFFKCQDKYLMFEKIKLFIHNEFINEKFS